MNQPPNEPQAHSAAFCGDCAQEMKPGHGCPFPRLEIAGDIYARLPYENPIHELVGVDIPYCHDCNVGAGQIHHLGCDMERCPVCGQQLISCGHLDADYRVRGEG